MAVTLERGNDQLHTSDYTHDIPPSIGPQDLFIQSTSLIAVTISSFVATTMAFAVHDVGTFLGVSG